MSLATKHLKAREISDKKGILSPTDDIKPLPRPYDTNGLDPDFKPLKPQWEKDHCASLDGFIALETLKRPETKEEEDEFVNNFLHGLEKLFSDANKNSEMPLALTLEFCAKCNTCSDACHVYEESNGDEIYRPSWRVDVLRRMHKKYFTPAGKLLGSFVGADVDVNFESVARLAESAYRCNLCRRCAMTCPLGLDNGLVAREIRKIFAQEMDIAPIPLHDKGTKLQLKTGSSTGLTRPAFLDTLEFLEEDMSDLYGREIHFPVDKEGADVMLIHNAGEFIAWPENPTAFAILLDEAGVDWTLSSDMIGYDGVNYGIWYDDIQAKKVVAKQYEAAKKLGVRRILLGECGHMHKSMMGVADRALAPEDRIPVESFLPLMLELVKSGKLKLDPSKINFPVTLHDPCNYVRQLGIVQPQRDILHTIAPKFREMTPHGVENYCCGGGSGFAIMNSYNFEEFRNKVSSRKKFEQILNAFTEEEILDTDLVKYVCAPCSNCKGAIRDLLSFYKASDTYNIQYAGLVDLMCEALVSMEGHFLEFLM